MDPSGLSKGLDTPEKRPYMGQSCPFGTFVGLEIARTCLLVDLRAAERAIKTVQAGIDSSQSYFKASNVQRALCNV